MYDHTNRQMSAALRRLGFQKSDMAVTRGTTGYVHPLAGNALMLSYVNKSGAVFTVGIRRYYPGIFTMLSGGFTPGPALWSIPKIRTASAAHTRTGRGVSAEGYPSQREVLLRVARALAAQLEADAAQAGE